MSACAWCDEDLAEDARSDAVFCSKVCRQRAWRLRGRRVETRARVERARVPLRMAYADPPYPGLARRYYRTESMFAGEVDHVALLARLRSFDGWALSTGAFALRDLLPLCPAGALVCPWVKPGRRAARSYGPANAWEPLIVVPGRRLRPGVCDWLLAAPARLGGSTLKGRKPLAFVGWLFDCLGLLPGDELEDLFPGSGVVGRAWREASRGLEGGRVARPAAPTCRAGGPGDGPAGGVALELAATRRAPGSGDSCRDEVLGDRCRAPASVDGSRRAAAPDDASRVGRRRRVPLGVPTERPLQGTRAGVAFRS